MHFGFNMCMGLNTWRIKIRSLDMASFVVLPYQAVSRTRIHNPCILFVNTVLVFFQRYCHLWLRKKMPHRGTVTVKTQTVTVYYADDMAYCPFLLMKYMDSFAFFKVIDPWPRANTFGYHPLHHAHIEIDKECARSGTCSRSGTYRHVTVSWHVPANRDHRYPGRVLPLCWVAGMLLK